MSDQIVINVVQEAPANINVSDASQNINLNPLTLNQGIINHSVTHQSGGSDELLHNLLGGLNGGQSGQYYHLSSGQYFNLVTGIVVRPSETGNFITTSQTGAFYSLSNPSGFITGVDLSAYVTGDVVRPSQTGNFITISQTGAFYPSSNPSGFITGLDTSAYVTGDVVRPSQTGDFYPRSNPSGFITGIDLSEYVTGDVVRPSETGSFVTTNQTGTFYAASNPSGFITGVDLSSYATQAYVTGASGSLQIQITNLSNQTGSYVLSSQTGNFITVGQTGAFYPHSNPSGFITGVDLSNYSTISYTTGISGNLQSQINTLSSQTGSYALQSQTGSFLTTDAADNRFVSLSGNQTIYGTKSFSNDIYINRLYVTGSETIVSTNNFSVQSPYVVLNLTGGAVDGGIFFVTGSGLTGVNDLGPIIGFDHSTNFKFGISTRASDLSSLPTIGSVEQINALSGYLDPKITTLNNQTGSYALKSETGSFVTTGQTGAFYAASNPSGFITGVSNVVYATGNTNGAAVTIGTNDGYALNLATSGVTRISIDTTGDININKGITVTASGTPATFIDSSSNRSWRFAGGNLLPLTNNVSNFGGTSNHIANGYFTNIDTTGNFTWGRTGTVGSYSMFCNQANGTVRFYRSSDGVNPIEINIASNYIGIGTIQTSNIRNQNGSAFFELSTNNVAEQRNGSNSQTFNIYNTYTSTGVYERASLKFSSGDFVIATEILPTSGTQRNMNLQTSGILGLSASSITTNCRFEPLIDGTSSLQQLGSTTKRWNQIYCKNISTNGLTLTINAPDTTVTGNLSALGSITGSSITSNSTIIANTNIQSNNGNVSASAAGSLSVLGRSRIYSSSDGTFQFRNNANTADATGTFGVVNATNLVYNTGDQTVAGAKTFTNNIVGNGALNTLPNQTPASTDQTAIATQVMTMPFPTFGGSPPMYKIFEDFPVNNANSSYIGTHGWYVGGSAGGGISNPSFSTSSGPLCYGAVTITSNNISGSTKNLNIQTQGTNPVNGYMHALFSIPDPTDLIIYMGFAGGGSSDYLQYLSSSGAWFTRKNQGSYVDNYILSGLISGGNFTSGTRYKVSWGRPSITTTSVHIATAPWNSAVWTTIYNNTVTHASWQGGWGQIQPYLGIGTETGSTNKSMIVDYIGIEFTTQR